MKRETALSIANYLNQKPIDDYVADRLQQLYLMMEQAQEDQFKNLQGQISELRRLLTLKETANNVLTEELKNGRSKTSD